MSKARPAHGDTEPLRICLVAHRIDGDFGTDRATEELIRHLHDQVEFVVVTRDLAEELRPLVARWVRVPAPLRPFPLRFVVFFVVAGVLVRRERFGLVHVTGAIVPNRADVATVQFCQAGHKAATGHAAPKSAPRLRRLNTTLARAEALFVEKWCYRQSRLRCFAPVSQGVGDEVRRHYPGIPSVTIPNGVDLDRFAPDGADRAAVRLEHGADDEVVALFVGSDWDRKGLSIAIEAIGKARSNGADVVLWVVGSGDQPRFEAIAAIAGAADAVRFLGRRSDTERFYRGADLFLFPTAYEAFSLATLEAAASGLPLVVPDVNGVAELVGDGRCGIVVERSADAVATAVVALAADPVRRAALGTAARRRAKEFTWAGAATATMTLYAELAAEAGQ